jgi:hypothetical protein
LGTASATSINLGGTGIYSFNSDTGISRTAAGQLSVGNGTAGDYSGKVVAGNFTASGGGYENYLYATSLSLNNFTQLYWSSTTDGNGTKDTSISRCGGNVICFGNGTNGDYSGSIKFGNAVMKSGSYAGTLTPTTLTASRMYTLPDAAGTVALDLSATTPSIGGVALAVGCTNQATVTVTGATTSMACVMSGAGGNPANVQPQCSITAANTVTPQLCTAVATTPAAQSYNIRVIQ